MTLGIWAKVGAAVTANTTLMINCLIAALSVGIVSPQTATSLDNDFETALGTAGMSMRTARFDPALLTQFLDSSSAGPLFNLIHDNPWKAPTVVDMLQRQLAVAVSKPSDVLSAGTRSLGFGTRRTLIGNPIQPAIDLAARSNPLVAVLSLFERRGLLKGGVPDVSGVPEGTQQAATIVLRTLLDAISMRRSAFAQCGDLGSSFSRLKNDVETDEPEAFRLNHQLIKSLDLHYLFAGAHDVLLAAQEAAGKLQQVPSSASYKVEIATEWGKVLVSGGTTSSYADDGYLLIIDTGGSDTYIGLPSNRDPSNWCSVVLDSDGSDFYLSHPQLKDTAVAAWEHRRNKGTFGPASALFGYAMLVDSAGNDLYRTHRPGLGAAAFGAAALLDLAGDDNYDGYAQTQGYGYCGAGILEDGSGSDHYDAFTQCQGFGGVRGFGALLDRTGDDRYAANDKVIDFPSPQSAEHNTSLAQGMGYGRRADYLDGHSLAGGIGILMDEAGSDSYSCGVFGQGCGYWQGLGALLDRGGKDTYTGQWYVQGASAHFAFGFFEDGGGDDTYTAAMNMALGAGHDFGTGMFLDRAGSDSYSAPNLSLGAGNANGIGVFVEFSGNDQYSGTGLTLGRAAEAPKGTLREMALCLGLFMDLHGDDTYPQSAAWAKNGQRVANWVDRRHVVSESQVGVFWDR